MKDEIKEILEALRDSIDDTGTDKINFINWMDKIEDYITNLEECHKNMFDINLENDKLIWNLQNENERLKQNQRYYKNGVFSLEYDKETMSDMIDDYKSRIEKAKKEISELLNRYLFEEDFYIEDFHLDKVLKTLDGRGDE